MTPLLDYFLCMMSLKKKRQGKVMGTNKFDNLPQVRFEDIAQEIQTADLFFASGNYAISRMIEKVSDSIFSHVGFISVWQERIILFESVEDEGVHALPLLQYVNNYEDSGKPYDGRLFMARFTPAITENQAIPILEKGVDLLNRKYNKEEIAEILGRISLGIGEYKDNGSYICSEYVDICFQDAGIQFPTATGGFIFPENIAADPRVNPLWEIVG